MTRKRITLSLILVLLLVLSGCFGSKPSTLTRIEISPPSATVEIGENQKFVLVGKDQNGEFLSSTATWSLDNDNGELNTSDGSSVTFISKAEGEVTLVAKSGNLTAKAEIIVTPEPPVLTKLVIEPDTIRIGQSETQEIQIRGLDQFGNTITKEIQPSWTVIDQLGTFNQTNGTQVTFTGTQTGEGTITATVNQISVSIPVTVEAPAEIPDAILKDILLSKVGKTSGSIFPYELEEITSIQANRRGISNLTGLEHCINLTELALSKNDDIDDLTPLKGLTNLETLEAWGLWASDPTPISYLTNLKILNLQESGINEINFLSPLTQLEVLKLGGNQIQEISPLANLTNLTLLYLDGNHISDITVLDGLHSLEYLGLTQNSVPAEMIWNLPASTKTNLKEFRIGNLNLTDAELTNLNDFINLERLDISGNQLTQLTPLTNLTNLQHLFAENNQIQDISALQSLEQLRTIRLEKNAITDLTSLVNNKGLNFGDYLGIWDNQLDLTTGSPVLGQIASLKERGVFVDEIEPNSYNIYQYLLY